MPAKELALLTGAEINKALGEIDMMKIPLERGIV